MRKIYRYTGPAPVYCSESLTILHGDKVELCQLQTVNGVVLAYIACKSTFAEIEFSFFEKHFEEIGEES